MASGAIAIPLALVTVSAFSTGLILEKRALDQMPSLNLHRPARTIIGLLSTPAWLAGLALVLTGLAGQVVVLAIEPISIVQPTLASGIVITLLLSRLVLRERLGRAEAACVAVMVVSLVLLAISQDNAGHPARQAAMGPAVEVVAPSVAVGLLVAAWPWLPVSGGGRAARQRPRPTGPARAGTMATALFAGVGAGLLYGIVSLANTGLSVVLAGSHAPAHLVAGFGSSPYLYLAGGCSVSAMLLYQAALQASQVSLLVPVTNVVSNAYFLIAGTWLFHEQLPASPVKLALRLAGIAASGVVLVALSRRAARPVPAGQPGPPRQQARDERHPDDAVDAADHRLAVVNTG
jgi:drug/metabolite transporter (DMT)-like permease